MTIDGAIKEVQEQVDAGWRNTSVTAPTVLALLRFVQAWDGADLSYDTPVKVKQASWKAMALARAAVDEALK